MEENINTAIKQALEDAPERNFVQSIDIAFTIKDVDLKNPTNRIKEEIRLPSGRGREVKIAMFAAGEAATRAREAGITVFTPPEIEELGGNKGRAKKIANPGVIATGLKTTVVVKSGDKMTFHAVIGTVEQSQEEILANAMEVYNRVVGRLERGAGNIRSLFVKTTMGPATRVEVVL